MKATYLKRICSYEYPKRKAGESPWGKILKVRFVECTKKEFDKQLVK